MILAACILYFSVLLLAYAFGRRVNSRTWSVGLVLCLMAIVIAILCLALLWGEQMGGLIYSAILLSSVFPIFSIGAGISLGGAAKSLRLKGYTLFSALILGGAIIVPAIGFGALFYITKQKIEARTAERHHYQSQTIMDKFGGHDLNIPITPQLDLRYSCRAIKNDSQNHRRCEQHNYDIDFASQNVSLREPFAPALGQIKLHVPNEACKSRHFETYSCIKRSVQQDWCERRADLENSIWCTNTLDNHLMYERYVTPSTYSVKLDKQSWSAQSLLPNGADIEGNPVQIDCNVTRDSLLVSREAQQDEQPKGRQLRRLCRIKYRIEIDVEVMAKYNVTGPETLIPQAQAAYDTAQDFWIDMKTREMK